MPDIFTPFVSYRVVVDQVLGKLFEGDELPTQVRLFRPELVERLPPHAAPQGYRAALFDALEQDAGQDGVRQLLTYLVAVPQLRQRRGQLLRLLDGMPGRPPAASSGCPYPGLQAFAEQDSARFFGRSDEIEALLDHALAGRWLWIDGASGVGKSSLVCAGLLPRLRRIVGTCSVARLRPGRFPLESLARAVVRAFPALPDGDIEALRAAMVTDAASLRRFIGDHLASDGCFTLVIDQLEEALTFADPEQARQFDRAIAGMLADDAVRIHLITTIRSDQAGTLLDGLGEVGRQINQPWVRRYTVLPLDADDLGEVVEDPLLGTGVSFEPGLAERICGEATEMLAATSDGSLTLLALALRELWFACAGEAQLTHAAYHRLGGIQGALTRSANEALEKLQALDPSAPDGVRRLLLALTTVDRHSRWTRQTLPRKQALTALGGDRAEHVLAGLTGQITGQAAGSMRLVVTSGDSVQARVDLIHESLLTQWPRLKSWLAEAEDEKRLSQQLVAAALLFREHGALPNGAFRERLIAATPAVEENDLCVAFQEAMRDAVAREQAELHSQRRKTRVIIGVLSLLVVVLTIETYLAVTRRLQADAMLRERTIMLVSLKAEKARAEAATGIAMEGKRVAQAAEAEAKRQREALAVLLQSSAEQVKALLSGTDTTQGRERREQATALVTSVQAAVEISQAETTETEPLQLCQEKLRLAEASERSDDLAVHRHATREALECYLHVATLARTDSALRSRVRQDGARMVKLLDGLIRRDRSLADRILLDRAGGLILDETDLGRLGNLRQVVRPSVSIERHDIRTQLKGIGGSR